MRDTVRSEIEIHGVPLAVVDTAGCVPPTTHRSVRGIERTWAAVRAANVVLVMVDANSAAAAGEFGGRNYSFARLPAGFAGIVVDNKIDLVALEPEPRRRWSRTRRGTCWLSAKTGEGVELLRREILAQAGAHEDMEDKDLRRVNAIIRRWAKRRITLRARRRTSTRACRRSNSSPRSCVRRKPRSRRSPASSPPMICWCASSPDSASGSETVRNSRLGQRARDRRERGLPVRADGHADSVDAGRCWRSRSFASRSTRRSAAGRRQHRPVDHRHGARTLFHSAGRAGSRGIVAAVRRRRGVCDRAWATPGRAPRAFARLDLTTGIFASVPGGAAEMTILSEQFGVRTDRVAAAQSLRIMIVVLVVPAAYVLLGLRGGDLYVPGTVAIHAGGLALLMAAQRRKGLSRYG